MLRIDTPATLRTLTLNEVGAFREDTVAGQGGDCGDGEVGLAVFADQGVDQADGGTVDGKLHGAGQIVCGR
ncbi:hypothetical protein [Niveispirillum lacus]|uniref:hypothetical protein n=1 Tax=Niveispirillum lacus TaxID=1981099 RepID=UPI001A9C63E8|nr:hypothetical protein [Niveispirillum lacus]